MKGKLIWTVLGFALGGVTAYILTKRREELLERVITLQEKLKDKEITNKTKETLNEIISKLNTLTKEKIKVKSHAEIKEDAKTLEEVEEKLEKLESLVQLER